MRVTWAEVRPGDEVSPGNGQFYKVVDSGPGWVYLEVNDQVGRFNRNPKSSVLVRRGPADAIETLLRSALPAPDMSCRYCGSIKELVPPAKFWFACKACHPATFVRY